MGSLSRFALEIRDGPMGQMSSQRIRYLRASDGVRLAWAEAGTGPDDRQGGELADPPRVRVGEPDLAPLDAVLLGPLPVRALRRARLRHDRLEHLRPVVRTPDRGPGGGRGRGRLPRAVHDARHLARRRAVHPLRGSPSRTGVPPDSVRRLRAGVGAAERSGQGSRIRLHYGTDARRVGPQQSGVPPDLHLALRPRGVRRADRMVQRSLPENRLRGDCRRRVREPIAKSTSSICCPRSRRRP